MRIITKTISALAALTAAVSCSAFAADAAVLGESGTAVRFDFNNELTEVTYVSDTMVCTVVLPENALPAGTYFFKAEEIADIELEEIFIESLPSGTNVDYMELIDLSFTDETGEEVSPENVLVRLSPARNRSYNSVFVYEKGGFTQLEADVTDGVAFVAPHCSRFVIAQLTMIGEAAVYEPDDSTRAVDDKKTDTAENNGAAPKPDSGDVKTGDNAYATTAVFSIMSLAALATAVVSVRLNKKNKG